MVGFWLTRDELNQLVPMLQKANDLSEKLHKTNVSLPEKVKILEKLMENGTILPLI